MDCFPEEYYEDAAPGPRSRWGQWRVCTASARPSPAAPSSDQRWRLDRVMPQWQFPTLLTIILYYAHGRRNCRLVWKASDTAEKFFPRETYIQFCSPNMTVNRMSFFTKGSFIFNYSLFPQSFSSSIPSQEKGHIFSLKCKTKSKLVIVHV